MSAANDDQERNNPFDWGRRPAVERPDGLAELMGSPGSDVDDESPPPAPELAVEEKLWDEVEPAPPPAVPVDAESAPPTQPEAPSDDAAEPPSAGSATQPSPFDGRKLQVLRLLLIGNLVMIGVMLALPHPLETRPEYEGEAPAGTASVPPVVSASQPEVATTAPFVPPARALSLGLPDDARYEQALLEAMEGRFDDAADSLRSFLDAHPDMNPELQRLVHAHLGYYLRKAGRVAEAIEHENVMRALAGRATLPEELLESARAAERSGDGAAMRRAYAQFLLQRDQLSPSMRALVEEAYLRFGDSYRVDADAGEERSR